MTDMHRRAVLRGTAITAMAAAGAVPSAARPDAMAAHLQGERLSASIPVIPDRATLASLPDPFAGRLAYLDEGVRAGLFKCIEGAAPADDPRQGLYVPSHVDGFHYARIWDGSHGRPEWFGAVTNDGSQDCADAIEACYTSCPVTELAQADYFIRRTLRLSLGYRTVRGEGNWSTDQGQGTRIILHASAPGLHTDDIMVVGTVDKPAGDAMWEGHFSNFTLVRDGACTPHPSANLDLYPTGLRASYLIRCTFRQITSRESSVGFYIGGVVYTMFDDCAAVRQRAGTTSANDFYAGYYLNGHVAFGYPGGNASIYMNRCVAADQHPSNVNAIGLLARGATVDTFIDHFESARIASGIVFNVEAARSYGQTIDIHLRNPVLDGISKVGLDLNLDGTASASIEIVDPYVAATGGGGEHAIGVHDGAGLVTITGGQLHGIFNAGSIRIARSWGVKVQGTKVHQASKPVVIDGAGSLHLEPQICNFQTNSPYFAVACTAMSRSIVRPIVIGAAPAFKGGISLDATCHHNEIDGTAVHPSCLPAPDARYKTWFNGGDARSGTTGTAFSAAGNKLVGVID